MKADVRGERGIGNRGAGGNTGGTGFAENRRKYWNGAGCQESNEVVQASPAWVESPGLLIPPPIWVYDLGGRRLAGYRRGMACKLGRATALNHHLKLLMAATAPAFVVGSAVLAESTPPAPATQAATRPATQPSTQPGTVADANAPLVIPDGTSRENPGPASSPPIWRGEGGIVKGLRG